ncbi:MAG TPA: tRNA (adenosine(37)-N6)-threonylcarbamoyltransferase complex dimerization subunit type 1 TsaB [Candidatus Acidoferrum sp.]|nr:tRNA (adenosine(37)-N6)-threonylcarbamoyltransferase complex dimerization subunit type 1 TsaB [Candidatus Acidoferrum sp.]
MILLALDTCDFRGSLSVLRDEAVLESVAHEGASDYSSWVLSSAEGALRAAGLKMRDVEMYAVAAGPGSFTGVRVGLTTVKAWSEAYGKPIASLSRLEALATQVMEAREYVAAFVDAQRGQVFGGLYRREEAGLQLVDQEMVISPEGFLDWVIERAGDEPVSWISLDPEKVGSLNRWAELAKLGAKIELSTSVLAPLIGKIGLRRAIEGRFTSALELDAKYVRRSDAEIFWKGGAKSGS